MARRRLLRAGVVAVAVVTGGATAATAPAAAQTSDLVGTFRFGAGTCSGGGALFRMVLPTGTASGPFVANEDSTCADKTITTLAPGSDGGLVTGSYQPAAGFDARGNSRSGRIARPATFFGVQFGLSTNATDPQSGQAAPAPAIRVDGSGRVSGDLSAFAASWNNQEFNQGAPKPGGGRPGLTSAPTGTYDAPTGQLVVEWASQIVGGPFNNFTGLWRLAGTFVPSTTAGAPAVAAGPTRTSAPAPSSTAPPARATPAPATSAPPTSTVAAAPAASPEQAAPAPAADRIATQPITRTVSAVPLWPGVAAAVLGGVLLVAAALGWLGRRRWGQGAL